MEVNETSLRAPNLYHESWREDVEFNSIIAEFIEEESGPNEVALNDTYQPVAIGKINALDSPPETDRIASLNKDKLPDVYLT